MSVTHGLMTANELLQLPRDGFRYELIQGELTRMSPASHQHGRIALNISAPLHQYVRQHRLGVVYAAETGFVLERNPDTVRVPDVAFVVRERAAALHDEGGYYPGAPDLAVEVISPHDLYTDVEEKVIAWLDAGTRMVLVVNPRKRTVTAYHSRTQIAILTETDELDGADVVPGWHLPVADIFA